MTIFGPGGVGKTSLIIQYTTKSFKDNLKKTIGTNFLIHDENIEGKSVRLLLWDIGGQAQFQKLRTIYFKGSNAGIGVFDLSNPQTLLKIPGWISSLRKSVKKQIPLVLIGNKSDLERQVEKSEAEDLAKKLGCAYYETSAKTGKNVDSIFVEIAKSCLKGARF